MYILCSGRNWNMSIFRNWKQRCMDSVTMNGKFVSRFMTMWLQQALKRMKFCWLTGGGDDRHIPFDKRSWSRSGFSYIALGHIHKPQALQKDKMIYAGALEPIDQNDVGQHGYVKGSSKTEKRRFSGYRLRERVYPQFCRSRKKRYGRKYKKNGKSNL